MTARCYAVSADQAMAPTQFVDPATVVEGKAEEVGHLFLTSQDEKFMAGIWQCSACKEDIESYPLNEFMVVLDGSVTCTGADGESATYGKGDCFIMEKGWRGVWHMTETFKKYFIAYTGD